MQEPPTSIIQPSPARGPRFVRGADGAPPRAARSRPSPSSRSCGWRWWSSACPCSPLISTVFGMLMAVASDLPSLDSAGPVPRPPRTRCCTPTRPRTASSSSAPKCTRIAKLTGNLNRILVDEGEISPNLKNAVIAIEDRRFYSHEGVDYTGIARALWQDILRRRAAQGGSTITQQFVKNALSAQARPLGVPEAARGRARLPPRAQVVEGEDPHPVPEHRVLRQRRLRRRGRGAHLLRRRRRARGAGERQRRRRRHPAAGAARPRRRSRIPTLARVARPVARRGGPARRDDLVARRCTTRWRTPRRRASAATWCCRACSSRR